MCFKISEENIKSLFLEISLRFEEIMQSEYPSVKVVPFAFSPAVIIQN